MIHIDRSQVETPGILLSERAEQALHKAQEFYQRGRIQERFEFDAAVLHHKEVMDALQRLFHQKCAYCETPIGSIQPVDVEHFRPKLRAVNLDGTIDPYHYFWLAYEWGNLFPVCSECNRSKGSRFPITGSRAQRTAVPCATAEWQSSQLPLLAHTPWLMRSPPELTVPMSTLSWHRTHGRAPVLVTGPVTLPPTSARGYIRKRTRACPKSASTTPGRKPCSG